MKNRGLSSVQISVSAFSEVLIFAVGSALCLWVWNSFGVSADQSILPSFLASLDLAGQAMVITIAAVFIFGLKRWATRSSRDAEKDPLKDQVKIQLFASAIRTTSDGMALTNLDGTFIWANNGMSKLTGYAVDEIIGQKPSLFKSGKQSPQVYKRLWSTVLAGMIFQGDFINRKKDGSHYTTQVTITPITNERGKVTHFSVVSRDISARVKTEESLRQGQDQFRMLVESMNDSLVLLDEQQRLKYANPIFLSKMGYSANEMLNSNFFDFLDEKNDAIVRKQLQDRRVGGRRSYDLDIVNRSGSKKKFRISPSGLFDLEGKLTGSIALLRDVTQERETESKLVLAKELAESMSRFQSSMLDNISHEFRTPLAGIIGFAEILAETATGDQQEMVDLIEKAGQRLLRSLNTLITMSSILSDQDEVDLEACYVDQVIGNITPNWAALAAEKNVELITRLNVGEHVAHVNVDQFQTVVESLIENAIKFTEKGQVRVVSRVVENDSFEVLIQDTGIGIDRHAQDVIFEPFRQESSGITRTHTGMGLGLSVVRLLVVKMGGDIKLTSLKNVGSEFIITLPLMESATRDELNTIPEKEAREPQMAIDPASEVPISRVLAGKTGFGIAT